MFGRNNQNDKLFSDKSIEKKAETLTEDLVTLKQPPPLQPAARPIPNPNPRTLVSRAAPAETTRNVRPPNENKILTVGHEITLSGEIKQCDRLVIEGDVDATLEGTRIIEISESGTFNGDTEVDEADIAGTYSGTLTAKHKLTIRKTGRVTGHVRYKEIVIESGGQIGGDISFMGDN